MLRAALWLAVLGIGLYIAYQFATPQLRAWRFRDAMTQTARLASVTSDEAMRASLLESAAELGIPLATRRLVLDRDRRGRLRITASWEEGVRVRGWTFGEWIDTLAYSYEVVALPRRSDR